MPQSFLAEDRQLTTTSVICLDYLCAPNWVRWHKSSPDFLLQLGYFNAVLIEFAAFIDETDKQLLLKEVSILAGMFMMSEHIAK